MQTLPALGAGFIVLHKLFESPDRLFVISLLNGEQSSLNQQQPRILLRLRWKCVDASSQFIGIIRFVKAREECRHRPQIVWPFLNNAFKDLPRFVQFPLPRAIAAKGHAEIGVERVGRIKLFEPFSGLRTIPSQKAGKTKYNRFKVVCFATRNDTRQKLLTFFKA